MTSQMRQCFGLRQAPGSQPVGKEVLPAPISPRSSQCSKNSADRIPSIKFFKGLPKRGSIVADSMQTQHAGSSLSGGRATNQGLLELKRKTIAGAKIEEVPPMPTSGYRISPFPRSAIRLNVAQARAPRWCQAGISTNVRFRAAAPLN